MNSVAFTKLTSDGQKLDLLGTTLYLTTTFNESYTGKLYYVDEKSIILSTKFEFGNMRKRWRLLLRDLWRGEQYRNSETWRKRNSVNKKYRLAWNNVAWPSEGIMHDWGVNAAYDGGGNEGTHCKVHASRSGTVRAPLQNVQGHSTRWSGYHPDPLNQDKDFIALRRWKLFLNGLRQQ